MTETPKESEPEEETPSLSRVEAETLPEVVPAPEGHAENAGPPLPSTITAETPQKSEPAVEAKATPPPSQLTGEDSSAEISSEPDPRNLQKVWLFRLAALLIPILFIEGGARLYWSVAIFQFSSEEDIQNELFFKGKWDKKLPYVFTPNTDSKVAETPTHINNIGYRGAEDVTVNAPYRGLRVLCIGDSVTFGYCVSGDKAAYPAVLERKIRENKVPCQVINGGMPRYRSDHMRFMFERSLPILQPQVFIVLGGWNDLNDHVLRPKSNGSSAIGGLSEHVYLVKVLAEWKRRGWFTSGRVRARIRPDGYTEYRKHLTALILTAKKAGSRVYLCTLPHFYGNTESEEAKAKAALFSPWGTLPQINMVVKVMNETIRDLAAEQKVGLIELTSIQESKDFKDAIHPNDAGSAKIADIVYDRLQVDLFKK